MLIRGIKILDLPEINRRNSKTHN